MGIFSIFSRKKDDFDSALKDPLSDPLGKMPQSSPFSQQPSADLPPFEMPGMPSRDETGMGAPGFSQSPQTSAAQFSPSQPDFNGGGFQIRRLSKGPQTYEEEALAESQRKPQRNDGFDKRDAELISAKLDNIKSQLENINQRLANLENKAYEESTPRYRKYNW